MLDTVLKKYFSDVALTDFITAQHILTQFLDTLPDTEALQTLHTVAQALKSNLSAVTHPTVQVHDASYDTHDLY